jgi:hypothetical protein
LSAFRPVNAESGIRSVNAIRPSAFAHHDSVGAAIGFPGLRDHVFHVARREELAFLYIDRLAGGRHRVDEIGLPAQEGRCLQHVNHAGHARRLVGGMHIGQHRHAEFSPHVGENRQAFVHAGTTETRSRAAIGLVVGRLVDERNAQVTRHLLERTRGVECHLARFDDARPGNQEQRPLQADFETAQLHSETTLFLRPPALRLRSSAARA